MSAPEPGAGGSVAPVPLTFQAIFDVADWIRGGAELTAAQREQLATLLEELGGAVRAVAELAQLPGEDTVTAMWWEPVDAAYRRLLAEVTR